jgi:hypothetical protein
MRWRRSTAERHGSADVRGRARPPCAIGIAAIFQMPTRTKEGPDPSTPIGVRRDAAPRQTHRPQTGSALPRQSFQLIEESTRRHLRRPRLPRRAAVDRPQRIHVPHRNPDAQHAAPLVARPPAASPTSTRRPSGRFGPAAWRAPRPSTPVATDRSGRARRPTAGGSGRAACGQRPSRSVSTFTTLEKSRPPRPACLFMA